MCYVQGRHNHMPPFLRFVVEYGGRAACVCGGEDAGGIEPSGRQETDLPPEPGFERPEGAGAGGLACETAARASDGVGRQGHGRSKESKGGVTVWGP